MDGHGSFQQEASNFISGKRSDHCGQPVGSNGGLRVPALGRGLHELSILWPSAPTRGRFVKTSSCSAGLSLFSIYLAYLTETGTLFSRKPGSCEHVAARSPSSNIVGSVGHHVFRTWNHPTRKTCDQSSDQCLPMDPSKRHVSSFMRPSMLAQLEDPGELRKLEPKQKHIPLNKRPRRRKANQELQSRAQAKPKGVARSLPDCGSKKSTIRSMACGRGPSQNRKKSPARYLIAVTRSDQYDPWLAVEGPAKTERSRRLVT